MDAWGNGIPSLRASDFVLHHQNYSNSEWVGIRMIPFLAWVLVIVVLYKIQVPWWIWTIFGVGTLIMVITLLG